MAYPRLKEAAIPIGVIAVGFFAYLAYLLGTGGHLVSDGKSKKDQLDSRCLPQILEIEVLGAPVDQREAIKALQAKRCPDIKRGQG